MADCQKRYPYIPTRERTQGLHERICARFNSLQEKEFERDSQRARYLSNLYYIDILAEEFGLSSSYVRNIINSRDRNK